MILRKKVLEISKVDLCRLLKEMGSIYIKDDNRRRLESKFQALYFDIFQKDIDNEEKGPDCMFRIHQDGLVQKYWQDNDSKLIKKQPGKETVSNNCLFPLITNFHSYV